MPTPTRSNTIDFDAAKLQRLGFAGKRRPSPKPVTLGELRRQLNMQLQTTDRKFNRMRPSMARVLGLETRSAKEG